MSKTSTIKLAPVVVRSVKAAATQAAEDGRKRPVVAINEEGKLVVCCRRTAKKNGWALQKTSEAPAPAPAPATKKAPATSRSTTKKLKVMKATVDDTVDEILGK